MSRTQPELSHALARLGRRPAGSAVAFGLVTLVTTTLLATVTASITLALAGVPVLDLADGDLVGNALRLLGFILVYGVGLAGGGLVGLLVVPPFLLRIVGWPGVSRTMVYLVVLEAATISVALVALARTEVPLWTGTVLVAGFVPAAARWGAVRSMHGSVDRPPG